MKPTSDHDHPEFETLLAFAAGACPEGTVGSVAAHVQSCVACRLEVKRYQDFEALGEDAELATEAQWDRAELELARAWQEKIKPAIGVEAATPKSAGAFGPTRWAWLLPAAAAALAAFVLLQPVPTSHLDLPDRPESPIVRGGGEMAAPQISLDAPLGEQDGLPAEFVWRTELDCTSYTLEIFTADLVLTFFETGIAEPPWQTSAELEHLLAPGTTYLWSVRGYRDLQAVGESENGWFKIRP